MKKKYCRICGRELNLVWTGFYNEDTGEKKMDYEDCPVADCIHGKHKYVAIKTSFWHIADYRCAICGEDYFF